MSLAIECRDLHHSYGRKEVLHALDFEVAPGRILGLLGKNGAGKTTTINILMGFLRPTRGRCFVLGEPSHDISPSTRRRIGLLHEGHLQYDFMTIAQVERFHSAFYPAWRRDLYYDLVDRMDVPHSRKLSRMSCGQRSQVALGLILAQDPELMILDDYSMGLDAGYRRLFLDFLRGHVAGSDKTVLVTSHIVQDLEQLVDEVIVIDRGRVLVQSTLDALLEDLHCLKIELHEGQPPPTTDDVILNVDTIGRSALVYSFHGSEQLQAHLARLGIDGAPPEAVPLTLEDAFVGITGKY